MYFLFGYDLFLLGGGGLLHQQHSCPAAVGAPLGPVAPVEGSEAERLS